MKPNDEWKFKVYAELNDNWKFMKLDDEWKFLQAPYPAATAYKFSLISCTVAIMVTHWATNPKEA